MRSSVWIESLLEIGARGPRVPVVGRLAIAAMLLLLGCTAAVPPKLQPLDQPIALGPGEGALVVELDTREPVLRVLIEPLERFAPSVTLENLPEGRSTRLLVLPAGRYRWREFDLKSNVVVDGRPYPYTWRLEPDEDHWQFDVRPDALNYPGLLFLERVYPAVLRTYTLNRSAQLIQTISARRRALLGELPLVYTGRGRDDFLEFYSSKLARASESRKVGDESSPDSE